MLTPEQKEQNIAALRELLDGKRVECFDGERWFTTSSVVGIDKYPHRPIRKPAWKLPDPPEGREWHRTDWTEDMLPKGWRPMMNGEIPEEGDEVWSYGSGPWEPPATSMARHGNSHHCRTRRPLPTPPKLRPWTHDEIPVGKIVKDKDGNRVRLIVGKNAGNVHLAGGSYTAPWTLEHCTMDDGSPCGVLE